MKTLSALRLKPATLAAALALSVPLAWADGYLQTNLVATSAAYGAAVVDPTIVNAWGIAIRPSGQGGFQTQCAEGLHTSLQGGSVKKRRPGETAQGDAAGSGQATRPRSSAGGW